MLKVVRNDLDAIAEAIEQIEEQVARLTKQEQIDLCARLGAFRRGVDRVEKHIKGNIRTWRGGERNMTSGYVMGDAFKAFLNIFPVTRLDQGALAVNHPRIFGSHLKTNPEHRITFESR